MTALRALTGVMALAIAALCIWQLERDRAGLVITALEGTGSTPATLFHRADATPAPLVVIAHGFAGSEQLMHPFALTLAQSGYLVATFDFMGHGRNPVPMSGDVTSVDGTTQLLMQEVGRVTDAALAHPLADGRVALLGHSMASDIVVRQSLADDRVTATVAVSMFSQAVTASTPANLLILVGDWEGMLKTEALRALHLADPDAVAGQTVGDPATGTGRRAVFAPMVEHVGVLYSMTSLTEAQAWLDATFGRMSEINALQRGGWIALLLVAVVALGWPLAGLLPAATTVAAPLSRGAFLITAGTPALLTPLVLWPFDTRFLPVLVADYLALHFAVYGALTLGLLAWMNRARLSGPHHWGRSLWIAAAVAVFGIAVFGGVMDRYVASFFPHAGRVPIIAAMALGAVPFMLGDAFLTMGGRAAIWRTVTVRALFLASLGLAVALDFERLFFLLIILPVILLFFILFGVMGGWVGRRSGLPAAGGIGLGLVLAWSLGVTFPLFV
ncbi:alpha/beta hydrolase family protein [Roseicitreum antarcticum]|uniref:Alpha/beta hydrolase family protein n=1 Tax=Roseicitreum antarcticum TaxID=564137 RepID=A0A1H2R8Q1_9RHOB|nr:alpha/beta fold hydrolase [Roseicitreum antarcticum]SDW15751.1 Alpha/beta hydrolase family protein [Roseicitreum antarcticum]